jgi:hypothetical protein
MNQCFYDDGGNRTKLVHMNAVYSKDGNGRIVSVLTKASQSTQGLTKTYYYANYTELTKMTASEYGGTTRDYTYEHDNAGRLTRQLQNVFTPNSTTTYNYEWDALYRLTKEARTGTPSGNGDYTTTWAFDSAGNRTAMTKELADDTVEVQTYTYNAAEQMTGMSNTVDGDLTVAHTYSYDAAGRMTKDDINCLSPELDKTVAYSWDALGRLTKVTRTEEGRKPTSVTYKYDTAGRRVRRVVLSGGTSVTKTWSYQGENIASVHSSDASDVQRVYTVAPGQIGNALDRHDVDPTANGGEGSTTSQYYLYNHRGDMVGVTDKDGVLKALHEYDAYGNVTTSYSSGGGAGPEEILFSNSLALSEVRVP